MVIKLSPELKTIWSKVRSLFQSGRLCPYVDILCSEIADPPDL